MGEENGKAGANHVFGPIWALDLKSEPASSQTRSERTLYRNLYRFDPQKTPDLALVVEVWPKLPDAIKAGILAMVNAVAAGKGDW